MSASGRFVAKLFCPSQPAGLTVLIYVCWHQSSSGRGTFLRLWHHPFLGKNNRRADGKIVGQPLHSRVLRRPFAKPPPAVSRHALIWVPSRMAAQETACAGNCHANRKSRTHVSYASA